MLLGLGTTAHCLRAAEFLVLSAKRSPKPWVSASLRRWQVAVIAQARRMFFLGSRREHLTSLCSAQRVCVFVDAAGTWARTGSGWIPQHPEHLRQMRHAHVTKSNPPLAEQEVHVGSTVGSGLGGMGGSWQFWDQPREIWKAFNPEASDVLTQAYAPHLTE